MDTFTFPVENKAHSPRRKVNLVTARDYSNLWKQRGHGEGVKPVKETRQWWGRVKEEGHLVPIFKGGQFLSKARPLKIHSPVYSVMTLEPLERKRLVRVVLQSVRTSFTLTSEHECTIKYICPQSRKWSLQVSSKCPSVPDKSPLIIQERSATWPDLPVIHPEGDWRATTSPGPSEH